MAHIHEKIDFTASVCIVYQDKVLFQKHKKLGIWLVPGGHIELDEDPNEAVIREAKEETGLDIELVGEGRAYDTPYRSRDLVMPRFLNRHFFDTDGKHEHIDLRFFARAHTDAVQPGDGEGEVRWMTKEDLDDESFGIVPDVKAHALAALKELSS